MAILSRRNFGTIELLRVDSNPDGSVSAATGSLAVVALTGVVYKNNGGTSWAQVISNTGGGGAPGGQGPQGYAGHVGATGSRGVQGTSGSGGANGDVGPTGDSGTEVIGSQGAQGSVGSAGMAGSQGSQGSQGLVGPQGSQGATGPAGSIGSQGSVGSQGLIGPQGLSGTTGLVGIQGGGTPGATGQQGLQGALGVQGSTGAQGAQGLSGGSGGSALVLVSAQVVTGAAAQTITFSGLDGDTDKVYLLKCRVHRPAGSDGTNYEYSLKPNSAVPASGISTIQYATNFNSSNGQYTTSTVTVAKLYGAGMDRDTSYDNFTAWIYAEKSKPRLFDILRGTYFSASGFYYLSQYRQSERWNETSTNLTSLQFTCDRAGGIDVNSAFYLYKLIT